MGQRPKDPQTYAGARIKLQIDILVTLIREKTDLDSEIVMPPEAAFNTEVEFLPVMIVSNRSERTVLGSLPNSLCSPEDILRFSVS